MFITVEYVTFFFSVLGGMLTRSDTAALSAQCITAGTSYQVATGVWFTIDDASMLKSSRRQVYFVGRLISAAPLAQTTVCPLATCCGES